MPLLQNSPFTAEQIPHADRRDTAATANPFQISPLYGILATIIKDAMEYDPSWVRPKIHEWGSATGDGKISSLPEGRYPSEGVTAIPFGDLSDPISQLALLFAPALQRGFHGILGNIQGGIQSYRELASAPQRIAAERAAWAKKTAAWDAETATFREKSLSALTGKPLPESIAGWTARDEAFQQWIQAHHPTIKQFPYTGENPPAAELVQEELAKIIQTHGWNPPSERAVVDLATGVGVPPPPPESISPRVTIEDILREVIMKSQTKWRP